MALSLLSRGTAEQKLKFIFDLYDTERTGQLTQTGLERLILSMNDILGIYGRPDCSETSIKRQAEHIFKVPKTDFPLHLLLSVQL